MTEGRTGGDWGQIDWEKEKRGEQWGLVSEGNDGDKKEQRMRGGKNKDNKEKDDWKMPEVQEHMLWEMHQFREGLLWQSAQATGGVFTCDEGEKVE